MPCQYAEVSVVRDAENDSVWTMVERYCFGIEPEFTEEDVAVILFEDETIYCLNELNMEDRSIQPIGKIVEPFIHFETYGVPRSSASKTCLASICGETERFKLHVVKPRYNKKLGIFRLEYDSVFRDYKNVQNIKIVNSRYNCKYDYMWYFAFGIAKLKSDFDCPRFLVAFDADLLQKKDVAYLVKHIFSLKCPY